MNNEPVAWMETYKGEPNNLDWDKSNLNYGSEFHDVIPLYTQDQLEEARKLGMQQERALWNLSASTQEIMDTHPVKELHLSLQKSKQTGELLAVTYTDDEHRIVEVLWQRPPVKELTDEEIKFIAYPFESVYTTYDKQTDTDTVHTRFDQLGFARAILRKAQEK